MLALQGQLEPRYAARATVVYVMGGCCAPHSGSGKSAIIDALRVAFGVGASEVRATNLGELVNEPTLADGSNETGIATVCVELSLGSGVVLIERTLNAKKRTSSFRMSSPAGLDLRPAKANDVASFLTSVGMDMSLERRFVMAQGCVAQRAWRASGLLRQLLCDDVPDCRSITSLAGAGPLQLLEFAETLL